MSVAKRSTSPVGKLDLDSKRNVDSTRARALGVIRASTFLARFFDACFVWMLLKENRHDQGIGPFTSLTMIPLSSKHLQHLATVAHDELDAAPKTLKADS